MAIAIVLAYCNSNSDLKDSDEACQEFAAFYFEHLHFLYEKSDANNPEVSNSFSLLDVFVEDTTTSQKFTGAFRSTFILQMFAVHLTAIKGAHNLSSLDNPDKAACGGLALCAAVVSIAITTQILDSHVQNRSNMHSNSWQLV
jgi:hypothetical protein